MASVISQDDGTEVVTRAEIRALSADFPPWRVWSADSPPDVPGVITAQTAADMRFLLARDRELRAGAR